MEAVAKNEREIKEYKTIISSLKAEKEELNNRLKDYKSCSQALGMIKDCIGYYI